MVLLSAALVVMTVLMAAVRSASIFTVVTEEILLELGVARPRLTLHVLREAHVAVVRRARLLVLG